MKFASFCCTIAIVISIVCGQYQYQSSDEIMPEFYAPLENLTATQGRDVHFTCVVNHLGNYRVAWIKSDSKAILAIHNRPVAHNPRLSVTHNGHNTWKLHISNIQKNDSGSYMCQINTDPMRSQLGYLNVTIPPDILNDEDGYLDGYQALEGGTIHLRCRAIGEPEPEVSWKREDGKKIVIRTEKHTDLRDVVVGENLTLSKVNRSDMGIYLCLARSSVPPIMSKRYTVRVNFKPIVHVTTDYVVAPVTSDGKLHCRVEASPRATFQWINNYGDPIMPGSEVNITEISINDYTTEMDLVIKSLEERDFGEYKCVSENTIGRAIGQIRLHELTLEKSTKATTKVYTKPPVNRHYKNNLQNGHSGEPTHHYKVKQREHVDSNDIIGDISSTSILQFGREKIQNIRPPNEERVLRTEITNNGAKLVDVHNLIQSVIFYCILRIFERMYGIVGTD